MDLSWIYHGLTMDLSSQAGPAQALQRLRPSARPPLPQCPVHLPEASTPPPTLRRVGQGGASMMDMSWDIWGDMMGYVMGFFMFFREVFFCCAEVV